MKGLKFLSVLVVLLTVVTGCWNIREIQDINYVTAVGFDYENGKYILYAQMLDYSSVAKLEGQQKMTDSPVWVGKGTGKSITEAAHQLYETSQRRLHWGHVTSIVFSERLLKQNKIQNLFEVLNRFREVRYTVWVYSTKERVEEILYSTPFFNQSPKASILHSPEEQFRQRSVIPPVRLYYFIMSLREKSRMSYIPCLRLNKKQWKENGKPHALLDREGIQVYQGYRHRGYMNLDDLKGFPWLNKKTVRVPLFLYQGQSLAAELNVEKPDFEINYALQHGRVYFDVALTVTAELFELRQEIPEQKLLALAVKKIEEDIRHTYRQGYLRKVDIFNLGESLFRRNPTAWHRLAGKDDFVLKEDSLRNIHVHVNLINTGRYKLIPASKKD